MDITSIVLVPSGYIILTVIISIGSRCGVELVPGMASHVAYSVWLWRKLGSMGYTSRQR
jgi:hypothetical protein